MNEERRQAFDEEVERLQGLLTSLEGLGDPAAKAAAQELVQVVIGLHGLGLADLLGIVHEAGVQPADSLLPRFAANPAVRGLLLLHSLHPEDLATRAHKAVERLRPHLGVHGVRAELSGVENNIVRISVSASGQKNNRPAAEVLRREIEDVVLDMVADADDLIIEGLETTSRANEAYVPISSISRAIITANAAVPGE